MGLILGQGQEGGDMGHTEDITKLKEPDHVVCDDVVAANKSYFLTEAVTHHALCILLFIHPVREKNILNDLRKYFYLLSSLIMMNYFPPNSLIL